MTQQQTAEQQDQAHQQPSAQLREKWLAASRTQRAELFPLSRQGDLAMHHLLHRVSRLIKENPSLSLTMLYLLMSLMGLLFQTFVLYRFGLNVLPYLEISDFLLSALTHPEVAAVLLFMVMFIVAVISLERWYRSKSLSYAVSTEASFARWWMPQPIVWMPALLLVYLILAAWSNGNEFAKNIRNGRGDQLDIMLIYPLDFAEQKMLQLRNASLISRTASYLFIFHQDRVKVLPHANVAALLPVPAVAVGKRQQAGQPAADAATTSKSPTSKPAEPESKGESKAESKAEPAPGKASVPALIPGTVQ